MNELAKESGIWAGLAWLEAERQSRIISCDFIIKMNNEERLGTMVRQSLWLNYLAESKEAWEKNKPI